jgi:hypothetical protein
MLNAVRIKGKIGSVSGTRFKISIMAPIPIWCGSCFREFG